MTILAKIALTAAVIFVVSLILSALGSFRYDEDEVKETLINTGNCGLATSAGILTGCLMVFIWIQ